MRLPQFLKSGHAAAQPLAKTPVIIAPEDMPATIARNSFPADFGSYKYAGPALADITNKNGDRQRGVVAEMVRTNTSPDGATGDGATGKVSMFVSLLDLVNGGHPGAGRIGAEMNLYYQSKIMKSPAVADKFAHLAARKPTRFTGHRSPAPVS